MELKGMALVVLEWTHSSSGSG